MFLDAGSTVNGESIPASVDTASDFFFFNLSVFNIHTIAHIWANYSFLPSIKEGTVKWRMIRKDEEKRKNMKLNKKTSLFSEQFSIIQREQHREIHSSTKQSNTKQYIYTNIGTNVQYRGVPQWRDHVFLYVVYVYLYIMYSCIERASMTRGVSQGRVDPSSLTLEVPISLVLQYCNVGLLTFLWHCSGRSIQPHTRNPHIALFSAHADIPVHKTKTQTGLRFWYKIPPPKKITNGTLIRIFVCVCLSEC